METLRSGEVLNVTGKVINARRKLWEVVSNEGNKELTKRIIQTRKEKRWQEKDAISNVKPKREEKKEASTISKRQQGDLPVKITSGYNNEVVSKVLAFFKKMMSICSLEAELRLQGYSVIVKTSGESAMKLARCRLILDLERGRIKLKIHKSAAFTVLVPCAVTRAVSGLNTVLSRIPVQRHTTITMVFTAIFKLFTSGNNRDDVISRKAVNDDVISQNGVTDEEISLEQALSEVTFTNPSKLFSTLLTLDVKITCQKDVVVELRKRQLLAVLRRKTVVLDARQGLQIVKEPSAILRRKAVETTIEVLASWVASCPRFNVWKNTIEVVKCLQVINEADEDIRK